MRQIAPRLFIMALCLSLMVAYLPARGQAAERRPYFKTYGADVMSGGWFNYKDSPCNTTDSPMPNPDPAPADPANLVPNFQDGKTNPVDKITGGIMTYTRSAPAGSHFDAVGGSSSQFAAFVLGVVDGNNGNNFGFYSNGAAGGQVSGRTFANNTINATQWGGLFQDDNYDGKRYSYCIPDYFSKSPTSYVAMPTVAGPGIPYGRLVNGTGSGIYYVDGTVSPYKITHNSIVDLSTGGGGKNITIYVNGDAYIDQNITFNAGVSVNDLPKFAVVAKGSIYISKDVTELYGFYVAQPDPKNVNAVTDDDGIIWTCHEENTARPLYTWVANNCTNKLTITGALAAKQVNFLRIGDNTSDVGSATTADDSVDNAINLGNRRISEVINYHPAMVLNGPFFTLTTTTASRTPIDSLISLPPVF